MKKSSFKRMLSLLLCLLMAFSIFPMAKIESKAVNTTYNATAAAEYARRYALNYNKEWFFYVDGGDCANFVSQSLFMGGMPMTWKWHSYDGNTFAYLMNHDYTWIRCHDLMYYLISIGGERIDNPSASDFEIGDAVFYDWNRNGGIDHSAIVTDIVNGVPKVSCHSTPEQASRLNAHWTLGRNSNVVTLVKLHGEKCVKNSSPNYDYYLIHTSTGRYTAPGWVGYLGTAYRRNTVRVTETRVSGGRTWGKYNYKGTWCWIDLSNTTYKGHTDRIQVNHLLGDWYTIQQANCLQKGIERRNCKRCEYFETREFGLGAHVPGAEATCTTAQRCTVCGETLVAALGHDMTDWTHHEDGTCIKKATEIRVCTRANDKTEIREKDFGDHNFVATPSAATCTDDGASVLKCSYCGLTKVDESTNGWSTTWATADSSLINSLSKDLYKSRTEYRYRTKSTTTSTSSSLSGWTQSGWHWGDYGSWSGWSSTAYSSSDSRQVETRGGKYLWGYHMICYNTRTSGGARQFRDYSINENYKSYGVSSKYGEYRYECDHELSYLNSVKTVGVGSYTNEGTYPGTNKGNSTGYIVEYDGKNYVMFKQYEIWKDSTEYRYRDRSKIYEYYKWGAWSDWSTSSVSKTDSRDVETRTTYLFKLGKLGHDDVSETLYATCYHEGYTKDVCKRCGRELVHSKEAQLQHDLKDDWYEWTDENGTKIERRDCHRTDRNTNTPCPYYEVRSKGHTHNMKEAERTEPTCTENGKITYRCTVENCDYETYETIDSLGHDMSDWYVTEEPTCVKEGTKKSHCQREGCTHFVTDKIPMIDHAVVIDPAVPAHCTKDGLTEGKHCSMCGKVLEAQKTVGMTDHLWSEWKTTPPASGEKCGEYKKERDCLRECGCELCEAHEEEIWFVDHDYLGPVHYDATCTLWGRDEWTCTNCGDVIIEWTEEPLGHDWSEYTRIKDPLCEEEGLDQRECNRCHIQEEEAIPPLDHDWGEPEITEADCLSTGGTKTTCKRDSSHVKYDWNAEVDSTKHLMSDWTVTLEPTCTKPGNKHRECTREITANGKTVECSYEENESILPLGHDLKETVTPATCTEEGKIHVECTRKDYSCDETIDATGHSWRAKKTVDPTCLEDGYIYYVCYNDSSHTKKGNLVDSLGHDYGDFVDDENGETHTKTCKREICNNSVFEHTKTMKHHVAEIERQEATYDEKGWIKYKCTDCTYSYTEELEKVVPSEIEPEKKAENINGKAVITLSASAATNYVKVISEKKTPVDVVLVLDQSGSMKNKVDAAPNADLPKKEPDDSKRNVLINCAKQFVESIYSEAEASGADHRIALVGFSNYYNIYDGEYVANDYTATASEWVDTGLIATNTGFAVGARDFIRGGNKYALDAFIPVKTNKERILSGLDRLQANGATAADCGMKIAEKIIGTDTATDREKVVVFITDGVPTHYNFDRTTDVEDAASGAIEAAKTLKTALGAKVYTVAIYDSADINAEFTAPVNGITTSNGKNVSYDINRFMHAVSSNYPSAEGMGNLGEKASNSYYMTVNNTESFEKIFDKVLVSEIDKPELFDMVTLYDTLSENVTLTVEDELKLRDEVKTKYGLSDEDIVVIRDENKTRIEFHNVKVKKVDGKYVASITFSASLNENALKGGKNYDTNTADAGVQLNGATQKTFEIPQVTVLEDRHIVVFKINGKVYSIKDYNIGDKIEIPTTVLAEWDGVDETVTDDVVSFEASKVNERPYTVTWVINGKEVVDTYNFGDEIAVPENVEAPEGKVFDYWTPSVSRFMPAANVKYTAVYTDEHIHSYAVTGYTGDCVSGRYKVKTCSCGDVKEELIGEKGSHSYTISVSENSEYECALSCSVCGKASAQYIAIAENKKGGNNRYINFTLYDGKKIVQPNENGVTIKIYMGTRNNGKYYNVYRLERGTNNVVAERVCVSGGYLTFTADHFSIYAICPLDESGNLVEEPVYGKAYCDIFGHMDKDGDGNCDSCTSATGESKDENKALCKHLCHSSSGFVRFIWKIILLFAKPLGASRYCECGSKHY